MIHRPDRAQLLSTRDGRVLEAVARAVREAGGRALVVGGWVRDALLGRASGDLDLEVHGLEAAKLGALLEGFGDVVEVGRSFGVFRIKGVDGDIALPRRDSGGDAAARAGGEAHIGFEAAARRRDLTINAMGFDPLTGELLDPLGGLRDLEAGTLRAADPARFGDDPLRGLRVAQLAARLDLEPEPGLVALCAGLDLAGLPGERLLEEWRKLVAGSRRPSRGMEFLRRSGLVRFSPEVEDLIAVPQDPTWHPEGDVWVHTAMVLDAAVALRTGERAADEALGFAALAHDFGKPATTVRERGRLRSPGHDVAGVPRCHAFLERLRAPNDLRGRVATLVRHHLAPALLVGQEAGARAYRRLARRLAAGGVDAALLERVARADHLGRTTDEARAGVFPAGDRFLEEVRALEVERRPTPDVVRGRHLLALGLRPGPEFGALLDACRDHQDATGERDAGAILRAVLGPRDHR
ncbi:MAG: CCA tRNA nucleotidyltransferase [Myxococcota bacterium]